MLRKGETVRRALSEIAAAHPTINPQLRGRGLIQGIATDQSDIATDVAREAFARGVIMETSGPDSEVIKLLPPLTIDDATLERGLAVVRESVAAAVKQRRREGELILASGR